jgi:hypothetical protein
MRSAVASGFDPYGLNLAEKNPIGGGLQAYLQSFKFSDEDLSREWKQKLAVDTTDWHLCPKCHQVVTGYV